MAFLLRYTPLFRNVVLSHNYEISNVRIFTQKELIFTNMKVFKWQLRVALFQTSCTASFHISRTNLKRRKTAEERKASRIIEYTPKSKAPFMEVWRDITVSELATLFDRNVNYVRELFQDHTLGPNTMIGDVKLLQLGLQRSGHRIKFIAKPRNVIEEIEEKDAFPRPPAKPEDLKFRPPVVTVMGHVDHGKTTLLDALRHTNVVQQEFGGITQHIGAFNVVLESGAKITFLDTPGHAAFKAMRERGANLTDIVVLVVAADDGVMEQTVESIRMARQAGVPILVAINKIDAPRADIERTEKMLLQVGIQVEKMGGDVQAVYISALKKQNLDKLMEALTVQAELMEIKADPTGFVEAVVIDSKVDTSRGRLCTVVVQRGTLKNGAVLVSGTSMAKVRLLKDAAGAMIEEVQPGYPAEVEGWRDLPPAGELVLQVSTEKRARDIIKVRHQKQQLERQEKDSVIIAAKQQEHLQNYKEQLRKKRSMGRFKLRREGPRKPEIEKDDGFPSVNVVIKGDVDGTLEAILDTLSTYQSKDCNLEIIHHGVGTVTPNDIELAEAFDGFIYTFNVECSNSIKELATAHGVTIKHNNVIYKLVDDLKEEINKKLPLKKVEDVVGKANVLQQFLINEGKKKIPVAGCRCSDGVLKRNAKYKVMRHDAIIYEGGLSSMRHLKNEVEQIKKDVECGLQFDDRTVEFKPGDTILCIEVRMEPQKTDWDPGF